MRGDDRVGPVERVAVTVWGAGGHAEVHYGPVEDPLRNVPANIVHRAHRIETADGRVLKDRG